MSLALMKSWIPSPVEEGKGKGGREGRKRGRKKEKKRHYRIKASEGVYT